MIRVEGGRSSVTLVDLDALLNRYGVTSESQRERIQALGRGARERAWWARYKGEDLSPTHLEYVGFEAGTACLRQYTSGWVPGLLQTQAYAEVLLTIAIDATEGTTALKLRMERQAQLARRSESPRQHYVIDEAVVRRHVGIKRHPAIMPEQRSGHPVRGGCPPRAIRLVHAARV